MTDQTRTPWPRSRPPFWRGVLHVAIATGVGNVIWSAGVFFTLRAIRPGLGPSATPHVLPIVGLSALCGFGLGSVAMIGAVAAVLGDAEDRVRFAVVGALCLGVLTIPAIVIAAFLSFTAPGMPKGKECLFACLGLAPPSAIGIILLTFYLWVPGLCSRSLKWVFCLGTFLFYAGMGWAYGTIVVAFRLDWQNKNPQSASSRFATSPLVAYALNPFTVSVSAFVVLSLAFSIVAVLLTRVAGASTSTEDSEGD